ncbi:membrane protein insertion efficiency factor YidD [Candidatus Woesearchaeota archaeon]|nr:membrane protein insertion efficiency factor YidD [Candidatus Woesearchaeota archaeon]
MLEKVATGAIRFYQDYVSKRKCPHGTKYNEEHCSDYGIRAISEEGLIRGGLRTIARVASCFRRDADAYVSQGKTLAELAMLAVDAYRFNRIRTVRGGSIAVEMRDVSNFFYRSNWLRARPDAGFSDVCCGCDGYDELPGSGYCPDDDDAEDECCMD